jgi:hypothetical protein
MKDGILIGTIFLLSFLTTVLITNNIEKQHHDPKWLWELKKK